MLSLLHSKTSSSKKRKMTTNLQPSLPSKKKTNDSSSGTMRRLLERIKVLNMSIIRKGDEKVPNLVSANSFAFCFAWDWLVGEGRGGVGGRAESEAEDSTKNCKRICYTTALVLHYFEWKLNY